MGAPPGWGPNWKENEEKERYTDTQCAAEKSQRRDKEEKRSLEILRNGDLVMRDDGQTGVIVEAGYRSWVEVHINGKNQKWSRDCIEVIPKNGDLVKHKDTDETGVVVEAELRYGRSERQLFIDVLINGKIRKWNRAYVEVIDESR